MIFWYYYATHEPINFLLLISSFIFHIKFLRHYPESFFKNSYLLTPYTFNFHQYFHYFTQKYYLLLNTDKPVPGQDIEWIYFPSDSF